jgi:hypothetical protein
MRFWIGEIEIVDDKEYVDPDDVAFEVCDALYREVKDDLRIIRCKLRPAKLVPEKEASC